MNDETENIIENPKSLVAWKRECADLTRQLAEARDDNIDHIRWLREMVIDYRLDSDNNKTAMRVAINTMIHSQREEIARLRKALKRISTLEYQKLQFEYCKQIAKAALEASDG